MQSQLKSFEATPAHGAAALPSRPSKSANWWLDMRRAKGPGAVEPSEVTDLTGQFLAEREPQVSARQAMEVDLSFPADRIVEAYEVLEVLESLGHRVSADQADWVPSGTKAVMVWWKAGAEDQAKAVFEQLRQIETMSVTLAADPANPNMVGDIQVALGRDI